MKRDSNTKKKLNYEPVDSRVSGEVVFIGDITSGNSMRFEGNMRGNVNVSGNFIVGRNALITGNIKANNVHVIGTVDGNIDCELLKILSTGKVTGDATVDSIIIDEGAFLVGKCRTREDKSDNPDIEDILSVID